MNRFLQKVIASGLRPVRPRDRAIEPIPQGMRIETLPEAPPLSPALPGSGIEARTSPMPDEEISEGAPSFSPPFPEETRPRPEPRPDFSTLSPPPAERRKEPIRPAGESGSTKVDAEILSAEAMWFNPARLGLPPKLGTVKPSAGDADPEPPRPLPSAGEIVWEVVSTESLSRMGRPVLAEKGRVLQGKPAGPDSSDPLQAAMSKDRPAERGKEGESSPGPFPKSAGPIPRREALPLFGAGPKEEKGDLIIEQLEVRVVAESAAAPQTPKPRAAAPKPSGAWETANRYYLRKV